MNHRRIIGLVLVMVILAGCNFSQDKESPKPTLGTPIAWSTPRTETATPEATDTTEPSSTPIRTVTATETATVVFTNTPTNSPTPPPSFTPADWQLPTRTPLPTLTPNVIASPTTQYVQPPTFTPVLAPQTPPTPVPTVVSALVCATCDYLRVRESPGTSSAIVTQLPANTPLTIIGRTADNAWVQVVLPDGVTGWVAASYLVINIDLNTVGVTGSIVAVVPTAIEPETPGGYNVVSGVTSTSRQIFLDGRARGNLPHTFTRVGDSISAAPQFLTQIGQGTYSLGEYSFLSGAIGFFSGPNAVGANPFAASSIAARNGWGTTSALDPANSPAGVCRAGETPLECEYRVVKPSVSLIMFGTNDSGGLPTAEFRANMQAIVQKSIAMGVIPVLSTIPPKHYNAATDARVAEFNQVIVETARAYDIPLWNYYQAMISTPNEGLSADGVHPSTPPDSITTIFDAQHLQYGYTVRNLTALQALYMLWQQVLYDGDQAPPATLPPSTPSEPGYSCPGTLPPRLTVGGQGRVTPGLPNKVRSTPALSGVEVGSIPGEGVFSVMDGPQCADGFTWWKVNYNGLIGWTANGDSTEYWVEPYP